MGSAVSLYTLNRVVFWPSGFFSKRIRGPSCPLATLLTQRINGRRNQNEIMGRNNTYYSPRKPCGT